MRNLLRGLRLHLAYRFAKVDVNAKCPGCGHRSGRIEMDPKRRQIVHFCTVCGALWGEGCVADPDGWLPRI